MRVTLKNGLILALPDGLPPFSTDKGYFILDSTPCSEPDLAVTPARYVTLDEPCEAYEFFQWEFVLGRPGDIA